MSSISGERSAGHAGTASARVEPVISVHGLVKRYSSHQAVAGIDLEVQHGEIFAFLGPNGAGKTTTVEILEGFRQRTAGEVSILGQDPATADGEWRDRVGVVLQESEPEPGLSVRECLAMYQKIQPDDWVTFDSESLLGQALLEQRKFAEAEPRLVSGYEGMKQREDKIPPQDKPHIIKALERLVSLYEAWDQIEKARAWRKVLEQTEIARKPDISPKAP